MGARRGPPRAARTGAAEACDKIDWSALLLGTRTDACWRPGGDMENQS
jgi:hypothetical protein